MSHLHFFHDTPRRSTSWSLSPPVRPPHSLSPPHMRHKTTTTACSSPPVSSCPMGPSTPRRATRSTARRSRWWQTRKRKRRGQRRRRRSGGARRRSARGSAPGTRVCRSVRVRVALSRLFLCVYLSVSLYVILDAHATAGAYARADEPPIPTEPSPTLPVVPEDNEDVHASDQQPLLGTHTIQHTQHTQHTIDNTIQRTIHNTVQYRHISTLNVMSLTCK